MVDQARTGRAAGRRRGAAGHRDWTADKPDFTSIRIDVDMRTSAWMPSSGLRKMPAMRRADG
jgi:hypothetical protein